MREESHRRGSRTPTWMTAVLFALMSLDYGEHLIAHGAHCHHHFFVAQHSVISLARFTMNRRRQWARTCMNRWSHSAELPSPLQATSACVKAGRATHPFSLAAFGTYCVFRRAAGRESVLSKKPGYSPPDKSSLAILGCIPCHASHKRRRFPLTTTRMPLVHRSAIRPLPIGKHLSGFRVPVSLGLGKEAVSQDSLFGLSEVQHRQRYAAGPRLFDQLVADRLVAFPALRPGPGVH